MVVSSMHSVDVFINMEDKNVENQEQKKYRVITMITKEEKEILQFFARDTQRTMSSFLRFLLIREIDNCPE